MTNIDFSGILSKLFKKLIIRQARSLVLVKGVGPTFPKLAFRKRNSRLVFCIHKHQVMSALCQLYEVYGHFSADISLKKAIGKFY